MVAEVKGLDVEHHIARAELKVDGAKKTTSSAFLSAFSELIEIRSDAGYNSALNTAAHPQFFQLWEVVDAAPP